MLAVAPWVAHGQSQSQTQAPVSQPAPHKLLPRWEEKPEKVATNDDINGLRKNDTVSSWWAK